jgi:predicted esterase
MNADPHADTPVLFAGKPPGSGAGAVVMLHGRGGSAEDILSLAPQLEIPDLAYLAPQAAAHTWYPASFLAPLAQNEPWLSSALARVSAVLQMCNDAGVPTERIAILGFSQGACLATQFVATHPRRYGALLALTGGLIGPPGADLTHPGDLAATPAFFGSGDPDPHVPWARVQESAQVLTAMGARVQTRRYPNRPHTISRDELEIARRVLLDALAFPAGSSLTVTGT